MWVPRLSRARLLAAVSLPINPKCDSADVELFLNNVIVKGYDPEHS